MCRGRAAANRLEMQVSGPTLLTAHVSETGAKAHGSCQWCRYTALSGAARTRRSAKGRRARDRMLATLVAEETSVEFTDADGDTLLFRRNSSGGLDYYANGALQVRDLTRLRLSGVGDNLAMHIAGESAGPWASSWDSAVPEEHGEVAERAVALFEDARLDALTVLSDGSSDTGGHSADGSAPAPGQLCRCHSAAAEADHGASGKEAALASFGSRASFGSLCSAWLAPYCRWCAAD